MVGEAGRNLATGTSRALIGAVVLVALSVLCALADARTVLDLAARATALVETGGATHLLSAPGSVSGAACDALAAEPGITASGAVRMPGTRVAPASVPSSGVPVLDVTEGLVRMLAVSEQAPGSATGVLVSDEVAETVLPVGASSVILADGRTMAVRGTYPWPEDGRARSIGYAVLAPATTAEPFDECWATVWPADDRTQELLTGALLASAEPVQASTSVLNTSWGREFRPREAYLGRDTRWAPVIAAVAGLVLGGALVRLRRVELSSARQAGVRWAALVGQLTLEALAVALVSALVSAAVVVLTIVADAPADAGLLVLVAGRSAVAGPLALVVGTAVVGSTARAASLFRDVKAR